MQTWQLPEYMADILPSDARILENAKEALLALFRVHGYELVSPPLMEYTQSLLSQVDPGLSLKTIRVVDQISGLQLGLRADITPQITRIDAHLLSKNNGVNRLCYAGPTLHARPDTLLSTREPLQIGAELYGCSDIEADLESIDLMLKSLMHLGLEEPVLALGHVGVFHALAQDIQLSKENTKQLLALMKTKDVQSVTEFCVSLGLAAKDTERFQALSQLYGGVAILDDVEKVLPALPGIQKAVSDLRTVCERFKGHQINIDFSELYLDYYHTGLLFGAYADGWSDAVARGGRYDGLGQIFGRSRPAVGFSFDLKDFLSSLPKQSHEKGICVAAKDGCDARVAIDELRQSGQIVVVDYLGEGAKSLGCDRYLERNGDAWTVCPLSND